MSTPSTTNPVSSWHFASDEQPNRETPREVPGYTGIDHFGFLVDDVEETCKKLDEAGAVPTMGQVTLNAQPASEGQSYYEIKYRGPDGQIFDVTSSGWVGT